MQELAPDSERHAAEAFARAVSRVNGQSATARLLGVSQQAVSAKLKAKKPCSPGWVIPLELRTGISRHDLRPDLYPRESIDGSTPSGSLEPAR